MLHKENKSRHKRSVNQSRHVLKTTKLPKSCEGVTFQLSATATTLLFFSMFASGIGANEAIPSTNNALALRDNNSKKTDLTFALQSSTMHYLASKQPTCRPKTRRDYVNEQLVKEINLKHRIILPENLNQENYIRAEIARTKLCNTLDRLRSDSELKDKMEFVLHHPTFHFRIVFAYNFRGEYDARRNVINLPVNMCESTSTIHHEMTHAFNVLKNINFASPTQFDPEMHLINALPYYTSCDKAENLAAEKKFRKVVELGDRRIIDKLPKLKKDPKNKLVKAASQYIPRFDHTSIDKTYGQQIIAASKETGTRYIDVSYEEDGKTVTRYIDAHSLTLQGDVYIGRQSVGNPADPIQALIDETHFRRDYMASLYTSEAGVSFVSDAEHEAWIIENPLYAVFYPELVDFQQAQTREFEKRLEHRSYQDGEIYENEVPCRRLTK